ncbi:30S ribosomal protein S20 [Candidatus Kuenenbacteria bacterium CG_4_9_14_3_um_filter_39_14]|uniref:Small ribosomal subunit protein bS20 n=6 Tax=Candidatus Kueneniibacteriota TaxID=1752740 RepID=A0A2M7IM54_9BACT|nr:30S ribosomal protein S20 [Candidatus Kuenenbacteria bacterium]OIP56937.1 MAG: 30S ribosomal protein S20 [Candidatus Kuenenbacteria bacterium CG2_30_39_24]PIP75468.1 MAG: 30S ribosomal protein S20 [Candidatus Kuenenbacteria bacterium CG22_combo_CG10-13_8_21_14_all_39_9]PIR80638.1 MAG: 30S ribosomal protein S20 [Candidatus Kuenenbacteria bacterium CG10_big_fil_rev_8_21_14_0_10_39_14]PIW95939.1 MAG: 30S ribosomal protein S20 [Candidatus Kuenenbacteria bacterium CG_4_8_14_3_um_filter_39_15]PIX
MPQLKQSAKRLRQSIKRAVANKRVKDNIDYLLRNFKKALTAKNKEQAQDFAKKLIRSIDKAAKRNIYHPNKAARKKSRMIKKLNQLKS